MDSADAVFCASSASAAARSVAATASFVARSVAAAAVLDAVICALAALLDALADTTPPTTAVPTTAAAIPQPILRFLQLQTVCTTVILRA